jgi:hypothetical protein
LSIIVLKIAIVVSIRHWRIYNSWFNIFVTGFASTACRLSFFFPSIWYHSLISWMWYHASYVTCSLLWSFFFWLILDLWYIYSYLKLGRRSKGVRPIVGKLGSCSLPSKIFIANGCCFVKLWISLHQSTELRYHKSVIVK